MALTPHSVDILIIGGGCSGVAVAAAIFSQHHGALNILIAEPSDAVARGVAYGTELDQHLLNVPAAQMGIYAANPAGFSEWLAARHIQHQPGDFISRRLYGEYLDDTLRALLCSQNGKMCALWPVEVVELKQQNGGFLACGADGSHTIAAHVILALGHNKLSVPVEMVQGTYDARFVVNPWNAAGYEGVDSLARVAIIGSGLTAMDVVGALLEKSYTGEIILISRRGLLPCASTYSSHYELIQLADEITKLPLRALIKNIRSMIRARVSAGLEWYSVIDALRSVTPQIWNRLKLTERRSFLSHLRPYWEVARHRMPAQVRAALDQDMQRGKIKIIRGRVQKLDFTCDSKTLSMQVRSLNLVRDLKVDRLFNCAGSGALKASDLPTLLASLVSEGLVNIDSFGLGIECTLQGEVCGVDQKPVRGLYALGPLRRASEWESTAVREIRAQAARIADLYAQAKT